MPKSPRKFLSRQKPPRQISSANKNTFVYELYKLASDATVTGIYWSDDGKSVTIHKDLMENEVLPKYFQTDKFTSFARQHYIYGFSKLTDGRKDKSLKGITKLQNKFFQKDRPELLGLIKRRQTTAKKVIEPSERKSRTERIRQRSLGKQKPTLQSAQTSTSIPFLTPAPSSTVAIFSAEPAPPMEASAMGNNASAPANDTSLQAMVQENIAKAHMSSQLDQACKALKVLNNVYELLDLEARSNVCASRAQEYSYRYGEAGSGQVHKRTCV
ncbi:HSF-type DNA-binding-domain-containing protein [Coemansia mojavensis]|nr:HSF-type DNA-binding-domain-containing protein [Coemansia mojavensis]